LAQASGFKPHYQAELPLLASNFIIMRRVALAALGTFAVLRPLAATRSDVGLAEGPLEAMPVADAPPLNLDLSAIMLGARGTGQMSSPPSASSTERDAEESGALLDLSPPNAVANPVRQVFNDVMSTPAAKTQAEDGKAQAENGTPHKSCEGKFGALNEKMTVVGLDPPGGCVPGKKLNDVFTHFAGGSDADCQPPAPADTGCHRYVVARYGEGCDLDPLQSVLGQRVKMEPWAKFDKDGLYTQCSQAPMLQTRTLLYLGSGATACSEAFCGKVDKSGAAMWGSSLWVCCFLAAISSGW